MGYLSLAEKVVILYKIKSPIAYTEKVMSTSLQKSKISTTQHRNPKFEPNTPSFKVFVGGLPHDVTKDEIFSYFSTLGKVVKVDLPKKVKTGKLKGFAFVFFSSPCETERVLWNPNHVIKGKIVTVRRGLEDLSAQEMTKDLQNRKLYVSGLPQTSQITEGMVEGFFSRFGPVDRVLMAVDPQTKKIRGFCYVIMKNPQDYQMLLDSEHCLSFFGHRLAISPAKTSLEVIEQRRLYRNRPWMKS